MESSCINSTHAKPSDQACFDCANEVWSVVISPFILCAKGSAPLLRSPVDRSLAVAKRDRKFANGHGREGIAVVHQVEKLLGLRVRLPLLLGPEGARG